MNDVLVAQATQRATAEGTRAAECQSQADSYHVMADEVRTAKYMQLMGAHNLAQHHWSVAASQFAENSNAAYQSQILGARASEAADRLEQSL